MGETTGIAWCDATFNPWWGCTPVSPECAHCYALRDAKRYGQSKHFGEGVERRRFGDKHWNEPRRWNAEAKRARVRRRVFCASMADVFDAGAEAEDRVRLWVLIDETPALDWLLLTKRPENAKRMLPQGWLDKPRANVWLGVTAGDQKRVDERIPILLETPAALRFVSVEPMLEAVDLSRYLKPTLVSTTGERLQHPDPRVPSTGGTWEWGVDWVIAGAESGPGARPCSIEWLRSLRDQCLAVDVPLFLKQADICQNCYGARRFATGMPNHDGDDEDRVVCEQCDENGQTGKLVKMPALDGIVYQQMPLVTK
jgi:protein gp37